MTYELAKELKAAGFPNVVLCAGKGKPDHFDEACKERYPTLSELIEACGARVGIEPVRDYAIDNKNTGVGFIAYKEYAYTDHAFGSTPEEAVARLWLALRKN